jgi:hypothetical protein
LLRKIFNTLVYWEWEVLNTLMKKSYSEQLLESVAKLQTIAALIEGEMKDLALSGEVRELADKLRTRFRQDVGYRSI